MPLPLFFRIQSFEQRVESGEGEMVLLGELRDELLELFRVHQPQMRDLPALGVLTLLGALGAIYGGGRAAGEAPPPTTTRPSRKRTPSPPNRAARRATSR